MSKMDGLRAMREARYEAARKAAKAAPAAPRAKAVPVAPEAPVKAKAPAKAKAKKAAPAEASSEELCGHKAISGRTCTREKGHAAKSHRYA